MAEDLGPAVKEDTAGAAGKGRLVLYCLPLVVVPYLLLVIAVLWVPTRPVLLRSQNTYLANLGYGAKLYGKDCQIVVYGDSTAMVGVDPAIMQQRTGLTTCNIAEFEGMTILNGTAIVDLYLSRNVRPRYLIFLFAPEDFQGESQRRTVGMFEALTWRFGQPRKLATLMVTMRQPEEFFNWAERGLRMALQHALSRPMPPGLANKREQLNGQLPSEAPTLTNCAALVRAASVPDGSWVAGLRQKYSQGGTTVLVDATPMPTCDPKFAYFAQTLAPLVDNGVQSMPLSAYTTDGRLHVNAAGSAVLTGRLADQLMAVMSSARPSQTGAR